MSLGYRLFLGLISLALAVGLAAPARAADPLATTLTLTGRAQYAGAQTPLALDLADANGAPVAGATVALERRAAGTWSALGTVVTDAAGHATLRATMLRSASDNVFRATYAGDGVVYGSSRSAPVAVPLLRRHSLLTIGGPSSVVDEKAVEVRVRWTTRAGDPVAGAVRVQRRVPGGAWRLDRTLRTGSDGRAAFTVVPRTDTAWRAVVRASDWLTGATSAVHNVDNRPPGTPVRLPAAAPRPRITLPAQPHAVGQGANVVISRVPDGIWSQMVGISWHQGCPVGRTGLRLVRINYWDYQGYRRRGELVANADSAGRISAALSDMYQRQLPIRAMYRVDRFGYSKRSRGGNDYAAMAAGNTSVFNCRDVTGRPGVRSPHSYGRSLDLNTWENPYRSQQGIVPNTWWQGHSHPRVAWRSRSHPVVQIMNAHGLRWTYGLGDTQHFDAVGSARLASARPVPCNGVCD